MILVGVGWDDMIHHFYIVENIELFDNFDYLNEEVVYRYLCEGDNFSCWMDCDSWNPFHGKFYNKNNELETWYFGKLIENKSKIH